MLIIRTDRDKKGDGTQGTKTSMCCLTQNGRNRLDSGESLFRCRSGDDWGINNVAAALIWWRPAGSMCPALSTQRGVVDAAIRQGRMLKHLILCSQIKIITLNIFDVNSKRDQIIYQQQVWLSYNVFFFVFLPVWVLYVIHSCSSVSSRLLATRGEKN